MFENTFIRVDSVIIRANLIKSVYDTVVGNNKVCAIKYTDGTETLHKGICVDDIWKALGKIS
jgi:hypothetical protein|nr:MAG TPA: hypothetical protein [Caudoviricetes sp.]